MTEKKLAKAIEGAFNDTPSCKAPDVERAVVSSFYPASARGKQELQAALLREAVAAAIDRRLFTNCDSQHGFDMAVNAEFAAWKACKESL